ncbi:hypothetical protein ACJIZ3_021927 [Penstemon smallii]|uniref:Uncharacterized protein n=1 Tax=Penstemon smallii TaxID=265156 RepID=A0ABD3SNT6_9LAMI
MESVPFTFGLEDGTIDVQRLLVEPQDGHVSMDSVLCFSEKIPENSMIIEEVSCSFGGSNIAHEGKDILNREVPDALRTENGVGYLRWQNDFCSMGEDFFLGVEFGETITNLDFGSSESSQTLVSEIPILAPTAATDAPWKSDPFRIMEFSDCQRDQLNISRSELGDVPIHLKCNTFAKKPLKSSTSCSLQNIDKFHDISSSLHEFFSDETDGSHSTSTEMLCSPKIEKNDEFGPTNKDNKTKRLWEDNALETILPQGSCPEAPPMLKRSRKPTQRYIDELADSISRYPKKRREFSSSTIKDKSRGVKNYKKSHMGSRAMKPAEETSVIAIQVPFASIVHKDCPKIPADDMVHNTDCGNLIARTKENRVTPANQKKRSEHISPYNLKKMDNCVAQSQKKRYDVVTTTSSIKKRNDCLNCKIQKKKADCIIDVGSEKRLDHVTAVRTKKTDDCFTAAKQKKRDDCPAVEIPEEVSGRRKHHRLWTVTEVRKLIDGVSQTGVGRWSRIKKLFFSASPHRTSVDLKDKWRNLLKASGILEQGGDKKRNPSWRPMPKSILRRVCELATMYPYPKGQTPKITHTNHDDESPDRSTHITLSDYRKILRSIN